MFTFAATQRRRLSQSDWLLTLLTALLILIVFVFAPLQARWAFSSFTQGQ
jgi:hypothetical protein